MLESVTRADKPRYQIEEIYTTGFRKVAAVGRDLLRKTQPRVICFFVQASRAEDTVKAKIFGLGLEICNMSVERGKGSCGYVASHATISRVERSI